MKTLSHFALLIAAAACGPALASTPASGSPQGQQAKKPTPRPAQAKKESTLRAAEPPPDVAGMLAIAYDCDMGNTLTIYRKADDDQRIALQWNRQTHQLVRKETSTGAERFESASSGWVWIGIPAKGMLLDSKQGRQLANECRNEEQKTLVQK